MQPLSQRTFNRRVSADNIWIERPGSGRITADLKRPFEYQVLETEEKVGAAMLNELIEYSQTTDRDIVMILLGGRGAQAMYRLIRDKAESGNLDELLSRLHVFTQDALAPMRMANGLSFVRDFERLLGEAFFSRVKSFTPMQTDTDDLESSLDAFLEKLDSLGGIDIFFLGHGPEAGAASHLCYIKPGCGARFDDVAGITTSVNSKQAAARSQPKMRLNADVRHIS
jgi:6-phosphogluconolactonase/glucosamine-6-phosphate isomerase/deaminase